ncbi:JmjC domain-containing histone demethylation protein 1 [Flagelloscypha sp. PMI_526]|nr:JmjC domain-containing histone demethylation protein 1 [Flagelloscypha sp. PMI_526]
MAPRSSRRRASRKESPTQTENAEESDPETCPSCPENPSELSDHDSTQWIQCETCKTWYHWRCAGNDSEIETIDKWFCKDCVAQDSSRTITFRPPARKSARKKTHLDYSDVANGTRSADHWTRVLQGKKVNNHNFKCLKGSDVNKHWLEKDETAMTEPIIILRPDGLGMRMPPKSFTVRDVADTVGLDHPVEVMDVATQSGSPGWTLGKWADYFEQEPSSRERIYNVISLEVSNTKLSEQVSAPQIVEDIGWVEQYWPNTRKGKEGKGSNYPKVQLYCLMGVESAWTDWHIDFAGSSVYYHILRGSKIFYFIRPTPANLAAYEKWSGTELQTTTWLGDLVDEVVRVTLTEGNTMIIPTGWIHAVATPADTLVFGGNFLHSFNVATQLKIRDIEIRTHVPKKFRFPFFTKLCWYVCEQTLRSFKASPPPELSERMLSSMLSLAEFLVSQVRLIEKGSDAAKKEARENVPSDRVKDGPALAREFRWRTKQLLGEDSSDEMPSRRSNGTANGVKRKRGQDTDDEFDRFRNYAPKPWAETLTTTGEESQWRSKAVRPEPEDVLWTKQWADIGADKLEEGGEGGALVSAQTETTIKLRRIEHGIERQRIQRTLERWNWEPQ